MTTPSARWANPHVQPEPTWEVALLYPPQGAWSEEEYLALEGHRLIEFSHGTIEILPTPTDRHQAIAAHLNDVLRAFVQARALGRVRFAPLRLKLWDGKFREPDLLFLSTARDDLRGEQWWSGADLVMEVVSEDDPRRDVEVKRREYARARIPEYWIVDPRHHTITVLVLDGERYVEHGMFGAGATATSVQLPGLAVAVDPVFAAE